jgi:radical SAM superfamily enzyme YgiQ (UPF0313 family)
MKILLVKPNMGLVNGAPYNDRGRMEPHTFAVLGGLTPDEHELALCDDRCEPVPYAGGWDLVGINTEVYTARRAYEIAAGFRARGVPVVLGGCHATMIPDEAAAHADAVFTGEADAAGWQALLADAARGRLQARYHGRGGLGHSFALPPPRRDLFKGKPYLPIRLSQFTRGCHNTCEFCATGNIWRGSFQTRDPAAVAAELAAGPRRYVFFTDENIVADSTAAKALFRALIPLKLHWTGQASLKFAGDPELLDLMARSGCAGLVVGFESRSPDDLARMGKRSNLAFGGYDEVVERIRAAGLMLWAAFLLGYDHETAASVRETLAWALSKKFAFSAFNILTPYPGTALYNRLQAEGRLLYDGRWWLHDDYRFGHAAFRPARLSPEQLSELGLAARLEHNSVYQILRRATDPRTNAKDLRSLATYFAYNPLFRGELLKKHAMQLGYRGCERDAAN